jgi:hypothetical protein
MHLKTTHPQRLVPRLPQRLVRRYAIQSVQVLQAATDQCANYAANCATYSTADAGCAAQLVLRWLIAAAIGLCAATGLGTARRWRGRWRRRGFMFISVWHGSSS